MLSIIPEDYLSIILRLVLSVILGGLIGFERASTNHDAGLRTHMLVCLGSAGIMILSEGLHADFSADIARIAAQVISGIGFLGTGCIIVNGNRVKGLTTAAGLWTTACVGLCVGIGYYFVAVVMTALMIGAMLLLLPLATRLTARAQKNISTVRVMLCGEEFVDSVTKRAHQLELQIISLERDGCAVTVKFYDEAEDTQKFILSCMQSTHILKAERL